MLENDPPEGADAPWNVHCTKRGAEVALHSTSPPPTRSAMLPTKAQSVTTEREPP